MKKRNMSMPRRVGVVTQIRRSVKPGNRLATGCGAVIGGFVPLAAYTVKTLECAGTPMLWILVTGALVYSAMSVYEFAVRAFKSPVKSIGFVVLIEGTMVFSGVSWLRLLALGLLIAINAVAAGTNLAADGRTE